MRNERQADKLCRRRREAVQFGILLRRSSACEDKFEAFDQIGRSLRQGDDCVDHRADGRYVPESPYERKPETIAAVPIILPWSDFGDCRVVGQIEAIVDVIYA